MNNNISEHILFNSLPYDMQVIITEFITGNDSTRLVPESLEVIDLPLSFIPNIVLDDYDRGTDYALAMIDTPPIIIADGVFMDGRHRCFVARHRGQTSIKTLDLSGYADPYMISLNTIGKLINV